MCKLAIAVIGDENSSAFPSQEITWWRCGPVGLCFSKRWILFSSSQLSYGDKLALQKKEKNSKQAKEQEEKKREREKERWREEEHNKEHKKEEGWKRGRAEEIKALICRLASICGVNNPTTAGFSLSSV